MRDGKTCSQHRTIATIENKKFIAIFIVKYVHHSASQIFTGPTSTEALAFKTKKSNLVQWIDHAQPSVEF
jgi:hypothetical protein